MRCFFRYVPIFCLVIFLLRAEGQPFDLSGPKVDVHVKRGDVTLPISETPNLLAGDRLWIHPDLPENQATHFVLVVAFLRGSTNPPPPEWFTRVETWTRDARDEGVFVKVPAGAQQALLFLAPATGGDFNTLRNTVRGRPGSFVRAAQDLQAASSERMRLETYLSDVKETSQSDPGALKKRAEMAARSLGIKINESCFLKPAIQQASCLSQDSEGMVLDNANAQSRVSQLTSGSTLDLMNQLSFTNAAGSGLYSPYVGAIVDTVRILGSLHTAHFQYIPALALPQADSMNLRLNMPPSFVNPKSVVVVALPSVGPSQPEPLRRADADKSLCATKPDLVLPAEGAPIMFATGLAHDLYLHIEPRDGRHKAIDLPATFDPGQGGMVLTRPIPQLPGGELTAVMRGKWGFDAWEGPRYQLVAPEPGMWTLATSDRSALVVGRDDTLHFDGRSTVCVEKVEEQRADSQALPLQWKSPKPGVLEATAPMKDAAPGPVSIALYQYGLAKPDRLSMEAYDAAASLEGLTLNAGDDTALLKGTRLDEVAKTQVDGVVFAPSVLRREGNLDELPMTASGSTAHLAPGKQYVAHVELKDGRTLTTVVTIGPPRPQIELLSKGVQNDSSAQKSPIQLGSANDLPIDERLMFFLKSVVPQNFPRDEKVEIAAADNSFHTVLTLSDGSLMLEDAQTAVGSLKPLARFGPSAFGPVRVRAIAQNGTTGDWLPLGTLVRLPEFTTLRCPRSAAKFCVLSGGNIFLATSFSATPDFNNPTDVPPQFMGDQIAVPRPVSGTLYMKLRDDPTTVQTLTLPVTPLPATRLASSEKTSAPTPATTPSAAAAPATAPATAPANSATAPVGTSQAPAKSTSAPAAPAKSPPAPDTAPAAPPTTQAQQQAGPSAAD